MFTNANTSGFYHRDFFAEITKFTRPAKPMFDTKHKEIDQNMKYALVKLWHPNKARIMNQQIRKRREMEEHKDRVAIVETLFE